MSPICWLFAYLWRNKEFSIIFLAQIVFQINIHWKRSRRKKTAEIIVAESFIAHVENNTFQKSHPVRWLFLFTLFHVFNDFFFIYIFRWFVSRFSKQICPYPLSTFYVSFGDQKIMSNFFLSFSFCFHLMKKKRRATSQIEIYMPKFIRIVMRHRINWQMFFYVSGRELEFLMINNGCQKNGEMKILMMKWCGWH